MPTAPRTRPPFSTATSSTLVLAPFTLRVKIPSPENDLSSFPPLVTRAKSWLPLSPISRPEVSPATTIRSSFWMCRGDEARAVLDAELEKALLAELLVQLAVGPDPRHQRVLAVVRPLDRAGHHDLAVVQKLHVVDSRRLSSEREDHDPVLRESRIRVAVGFVADHRRSPLVVDRVRGSAHDDGAVLLDDHGIARVKPSEVGRLLAVAGERRVREPRAGEASHGEVESGRARHRRAGADDGPVLGDGDVVRRVRAAHIHDGPASGPESAERCAHRHREDHPRSEQRKRPPLRFPMSFPLRECLARSAPWADSTSNLGRG